MTVFFRFEGVTQTLGMIKPLPDKLEKRVVFQMAEIVHEGGQRGAERHSKTGALVQSLFNRVIPKGRQVGHDAQRAPQALFVNLGTRPHVIVPNKKKALRWSGGGGFMFAKRVNHPGYRGDPYLFNAADAALRQFHAIVNKSFDEVTR